MLFIKTPVQYIFIYKRLKIFRLYFSKNMSKIVMANIKMPILVNNGKLQPMSEYIKIDIEKCDELPPKSEENDTSLMGQINKILSRQNDNDTETDNDIITDNDTTSDNDTIADNDNIAVNDSDNDNSNQPITNPIFVLLDEIQNNRPIKSRQNMSFKNKSNRSILRYTMKNRSSSSNTSDVDHSLQQEVEE